MKTDLVYKGEWETFVPEEIVSCGGAISFGARALWGILKFHCQNRENYFPDMNTLTDFMGASEAGVRRYLNELEKVGLLEVTHQVRRVGRGMINHYTLKNVKRWWKEKGKALKEAEKQQKSKYKN
jgi:hypothetical protein